MEAMKRVAVKHNMRCLLHEKPYEGVSGSGKHDNWSITTDNGINMLDPGDTPNENIQFLLVLACIMKAVDTHATCFVSLQPMWEMTEDWAQVRHLRSLSPFSLENSLRML